MSGEGYLVGTYSKRWEGLKRGKRRWRGPRGKVCKRTWKKTKTLAMLLCHRLVNPALTASPVIIHMDQGTTGKECGLWMKADLGLSLGISTLARQMD